MKSAQDVIAQVWRAATAHTLETDDWSHLNAGFLARYQVVVFLDSRPEDPAARDAFRRYMEAGGAWLGWHFSAFALTPSEYPQDWDWYHEQFLGSGSYVSNTWRPTSAVLRVERRDSPVTKGLPANLPIRPERVVSVATDPAGEPRHPRPALDYPVAWLGRR